MGLTILFLFFILSDNSLKYLGIIYKKSECPSVNTMDFDSVQFCPVFVHEKDYYVFLYCKKPFSSDAI